MQATVVFLHTHVLVVVLFLLLFAYKTVLLLLNKRTALEKARKQTRILDIIFGTLILITGGYLLFSYRGVPGWLIVKVLLVLLAIPLGIVGIKRESKVLATLSLLIFLYIYGVAETKSLTMKNPGPIQNATITVNATPETDAAEVGDAGLSESPVAHEEIVAAMTEAQLANSKAIYTQLCEICHGPDGAKGLGGAANLTVSNLSQNNRVNVIENGRGLMPAFGSQLSDEEVQALAAYTMTLKK
ncbi:c-type cytochrome [Pontibacter anaerobius]|uniref:Cytochrome c n=1 Tax=Pontibacter anaerobius TaxID=2993940 RepID=A0ABT3RHZ1_9BACT|nr:cytochrome c [Pontibacter anaerobius]MCX2741259.1 cytochrome c [Pontibacter anaerobius]